MSFQGSKVRLEKANAMIDARIRPMIDPAVNAIGRGLARRGVSADALTVAGFAIGVAAAACVWAGWFAAALTLILLNRLFDGLDGAVARATEKTDAGGFLDIALDFVFYGSVPLAFALHAPGENALPAAAVLLAYYANGSSFLAFAIMAAKRGEETDAQGEKSLFYLAGLTEGFETIAAMALWCLFPAWFPEIAWAFAALVSVSAAARIVGGWRALRRRAPPHISSTTS